MPRIPTPEEGLRLRLDAELERLRSRAGDNFTRYALTRLHPNLGKRQIRFGVWNAPDISLDSPTYFKVHVEHIGRLDRISLEFYGDPRLWWAIAHVNDIKNQLTDMEIGMTLTIPRKENVLLALETGSRAVFR